MVWEGGASTPFGVTTAALGVSAQKLMFPGQYADAETGHAYNWHRTYDPDLGRYLQADPIGLEGGINRYAYVGGNPVNAVDPNGLVTVDISINLDFFAFIGFSGDFGVYLSTRGACGMFEAGFFGSGSGGVGLDISIGVSGGVSVSNPEDQFNGMFTEVEGGFLYGAGGLTKSSGNGPASGYGGFEIGLLPISGHVSRGRSRILRKVNFGNTSFLPEPYTRNNGCECDS